MNPLKRLTDLGQSPWLDFIRRSFVSDGSLQRLIDEDGIRGVTSNPAIFEKAITGSADYDPDIVVMTGAAMDAQAIYEALAIADVQAAADLFKPVYQGSGGKDGFVSLEVSPYLAQDTDGTIAEGLRLWKELGRENVMVKVPATPAGVPAVRALIAAGVNVNVTLLFSVQRYREIAVATVEALEERASQGLGLGVQSVASFFVSRVDTMIDPMLEEKGGDTAKALRGQAGIANCRLAYAAFQDLFRSDRFAKLEAKGASVQRLLWASTSVKNPAYSPVMYVEALIGRDTVNTLPLETIEAYRETGEPAERLSGTEAQGQIAIDQLRNLGIEIEQVAQKLEEEGVAKFVEPFSKLIAAIDAKRESVVV